MKEKLYNFKVLIRLLFEYSKLMPFMIVIRFIIEAILPFAKLVFSSQVIGWLMSDISLDDYLKRLMVWLFGITILTFLSNQVDSYFKKNEEVFRISIMDKLTANVLTLDYPLLVGKEAQRRYANASELVSNPSSLFGRYTSEIINLLSATLASVLYISLLVQLESQFAWVIAAMIIGLLIFKLFGERLERQIKEPTANLNKRRRYLDKLFGDTRVAKDIRLYQMRDWFSELEVKIEEEATKIIKPKIKYRWLENSTLSILTLLLTAMAFFRSSHLSSQGMLSVEEFIVYVGTVTLLSSTLTQLINTSAEFNHSIIEAGYYTAFMEQEPVFNHGKGVGIEKNQPLSIELRNVTYTYPNNNKPTLKNLNLTIPSAEKLAIVGENGAGKSTLIKLILGLLQPDKGEILINGMLQNDFNIEEYYSLFSPVFQDIYLLTYTIKETVLQGLEYDDKHYQWVMERSGLNQIIENFGLGDETKLVPTVYQDAITLSGGQLQKLKLAQALYKNAPILILDEPTAALDPIAENQVYQDYLALAKEKTSLFISHRLSSTRFCDRIIYLKQGEITEEGRHDELMATKQDYYSLFEAQAHYYREDIEKEEIEVGGVI